MLVPVYVVLLHFPVINRRGEEVTTAVTNLDIHDIARSARTFGAKKFFIVTPIEDQHELVGRILSHWRQDQARSYHPDRVEAISLVQLAGTFDEVKAWIRAEHGIDPEVVLPDARPLSGAMSYAEYRQELNRPERSSKPVVLVFGTGWGVSETFFPEVNWILAPVYGPEGEKGYNHLSVRAAVGIILDRLLGQ